MCVEGNVLLPRHAAVFGAKKRTRVDAAVDDAAFVLAPWLNAPEALDSPVAAVGKLRRSQVFAPGLAEVRRCCHAHTEPGIVGCRVQRAVTAVDRRVIDVVAIEERTLQVPLVAGRVRRKQEQPLLGTNREDNFAGHNDPPCTNLRAPRTPATRV